MMTPRGPGHRRVWRPDLAYVVGLLATDGNLSPDGRHITLVSIDVSLLQTVAGILKTTNRIRPHPAPRGTAQRLNIGDKLFYDWLVSVGVRPRKTLTIGPVAVPDELFRDFLRGHLDGDGTITTYTDRYNTNLNPSYVYQRLYVRFVSASRPHIDWLHDTLQSQLGVKGYIKESFRKGLAKNVLYELCFAKYEGIKLLRWIYYAPDLPSLRRKRAIAEPFLVGDIRNFRRSQTVMEKQPK